MILPLSQIISSITPQERSFYYGLPDAVGFLIKSQNRMDKLVVTVH